MNTMAAMSTAFVLSGDGKNVLLQQASPGILVYSGSLKLQYVNRRALRMIRVHSIVFPIPILELSAEIQDRIDDRLKANLWEPFEMSQVVSGYGPRILLRGFGYPNAAANCNSRIVIVLEEIRSAEKKVSPRLHTKMRIPKSRAMGAV